METKKKFSDATAAVSIPSGQTNAKNLKLVNSAKIEDAQVIEPKKHDLNLDETLKIVNALYQKKRHRDKLETYINFLNAFDIEKREEDLTDKSYYQGCLIEIKDDKRANFELKNPTLIKEVVEFLKNRMSVKLGEIEAEIILPN